MIGAHFSTEAGLDEARLRRFARLAAPLFRSHAAQGSGPHAARNRPGSGLEFLDLRNYEPGDDMRHLDWRQSLRRQRPMIRRYRDESAADWFLCVDGSASMSTGQGEGHSKWALTLQLAAALSYSLLHAGHRVGLIIFNDQIAGACRLGRGANQFLHLSKLLHAHQPNKLAADQALNTSNLGLCQSLFVSAANAFVISDFLVPDAMEKDLKALRARAYSLSAIQVLAADETAVSGHGPATLYDAESAETRRINLSLRSLVRATDQLERHKQKLQRICRLLSIRLTGCVGGESWEQVLLEHLRAGDSSSRLMTHLTKNS